MRVVAYGIWLIAQLYLLLLVARVVIGLVMALSRDWRPKGAMAALFEVVYTLTDPPLRAMRAVIKPVQVGPIALDLAFIVVAFAVSAIAYVAARIAGGI
ncbi:MAG: YggT family protein [Bifidobacteriaceae bacterium]|nr:YggT family protein [Bifidobacteriaceae bacterium]